MSLLLRSVIFCQEAPPGEGTKGHQPNVYDITVMLVLFSVDCSNTDGDMAKYINFGQQL